MPYDEAVARRVRRALAETSGVAERIMMGALCFMVAGSMCCGVSGAALMIRVGRDEYAALLGETHVRPLDIGGRRPAGFVLIDPPGFATPAKLNRWVRRALDTVATLPPKKLPAKRTRPVRPRVIPGSSRDRH